MSKPIAALNDMLQDLNEATTELKLEEAYKAFVKESNIKFTQASSEEKLVILAKDVIAQLKAGKYIAQKNAWCVIDSSVSNLQFNSFEAQKDIESCHVCGLGGLLCSLIKIKNNATINELNDREQSFQLINSRLLKLFSKEEMAAIEIAFERGYGAAMSVIRAEIDNRLDEPVYRNKGSYYTFFKV